MTTDSWGRFRLGASRLAVDMGAGQIRVTDLTTDHLADPLGIDTATPRLSWIDVSAGNGVSQAAYEIVVSTGHGTAWDTGKVTSAQSYDVSYAGRPLRSSTRYSWTVRVWDNHGQASPWSKHAWFETAFLSPAEFRGAWIGRATSGGNPAPNPLLRKDFSLHGGIESARAYVSGLGFYQLYLNGRRIGDHVLDPAFTDYNKTVDYVTYDVTRDLRAGPDTVGVSLGNGWWAGNADHFSIPPAVPWQPAQPEVKFELDVRYADGTSARLLSDTSWLTADGPATADNVQSETYDGRLVQPGWASPGFDASKWAAAVTVAAPAGVLRAQSIPPIEETGVVEPAGVTHPRTGVTVYDFGTTTSGWARITMLGTARNVAEHPLRGAAQLRRDRRGRERPDRHLHPQGRRPGNLRAELGLEGLPVRAGIDESRVGGRAPPPLPKIISIRGAEVHTALPDTGGFDSSSNLFTRIHQAMRRTILNNQDSFGTDTPVYEKRGWTADNRLYSISALSNFGMEAYYEN